jgi:hypothetical protein
VRDTPPAPSSLVALEVALLASSEEPGHPVKHIALVVASDADERAYLADSLCQRSDLAVVTVATTAAALDAAARGTPRLLVATHDERAVLRHLPAVPAVLLSGDTTAVRMMEGDRLAQIVVLRGAFHGARLLEVVASLLGDEPRAD